jgi:hypothetical protein
MKDRMMAMKMSDLAHAAKWWLPVLGVSLVAAGLVVSPAQAQRRGGGGFVFAGGGRGGATGFARGGSAGGRFVRVRGGRGFLGGYGYASNYYPYYDTEGGLIEAPPPQIVVQTAAPAATASAPKAAESLVMELRGDHWVRLTPYGAQALAEQGDVAQAGAQVGPLVEPQARVPSRRNGDASAAAAAQAPSELPPAVLVFRDGHQIEAAKYTIIGKTISIKTDYWARGSWTRTVQIAELDLPATLKANQERGANFSLPSRPSEVVIRP